MESALIVMFMRPEDAAYFIGDVEEGDELALAMVDANKLPKGVVYEYDPEIKEINAIYAALPGSVQWKIDPSAIAAVKTSEELAPLVDDLY